MKSKKNILPITIMGLAFIMLAVSCSKNNQNEVTPEPDQTNINSFKMTLNREVWTPSVIDSCTRTFKCDMGKYGQENFFIIEAFKDPSGIASYESSNYFRMAIFKVNEPGNFIMDGKVWEFYNNYVRFSINDLNKKKVYQNKENSQSFKVIITQLFPDPTRFSIGVAGTFEGILYNIENPVDSIEIEKGEFIFKKAFSNGFNQCKD